MIDAQAVAVQLANKWPAEDIAGIVTAAGRTFHVGERCPGYQQGIRNTEKHGGTPNPIESVTAREARSRGKAPCRKCWREGKAFI